MAVAWARYRSLAFPNHQVAAVAVAAADRTPVVVDRMLAVRRLGLVRVSHKPEVTRNRQLLVDHILRRLELERAIHKLVVVDRNLVEVVHSPMACRSHHKLQVVMAVDQAAADLAMARVGKELEDLALRPLEVAVIEAVVEKLLVAG